MANTGELPSGLADMPAGPELTAALAGIDTARVSIYHRPVVALARRRQMTHHQALVLAESRELGRCAGPASGGPRRLSQPSRWAEGEVAALYTCSERAARQELDFAEQVITHMPRVFEAMLAGWLDQAKVWVFADYRTNRSSDNQDRENPDSAAGGAAEGGADSGGEPVTGVEIRVGLATLLGLDERCGQLAGFDYVLPETARRSVAKQHRGAEWRFAVTNDEGRVVFGGLTRRRPLLPAGEPPGRCRGGVVELHVSAELLAALTGGGSGVLPAAYSRWAPVLADVAAQYADRQRLLAQIDARHCDRFPNTGLARFLCIRDRTCVWPGCRRSAVNCQIDHNQDRTDGGPTTQANTAPLCPRHHLYKTAGIWKLRQTRPGVFEWISPLGRVYRTQAEPLNPPVPLVPRRPPPTPTESPPATPTTLQADDPDPPPF